MSIEKALSVLVLCTWLALAGLLFALTYAAFFGRLDLKGLLIDKTTGLFSIARLQLVGTAIVASFIYLKTVATSPSAGALPELDGILLAATLSGGIYGIAKLNSAVKAAPTALSLLEMLAGGQRRTP
jgi:hypothetical protein